MQLVEAVQDVKSIVNDLQKQFPDVVNSDNDLYYNHAYEILGMVFSKQMELKKLPNPVSDMEAIQSQVKMTIPDDQKLVEYVISTRDAYQAVLSFWEQIQDKLKFDVNDISEGTSVVLSKLIVPSFRQVILKRCPKTIPILYAPELTVVFDDLKMLSDSHKIVERWDEDGFTKVDGKQILDLVMQESLHEHTSTHDLPHAQTVDDLKLSKRFVLPSKVQADNGQMQQHYFDAMLDHRPGEKEAKLVKQ